MKREAKPNNSFDHAPDFPQEATAIGAVTTPAGSRPVLPNRGVLPGYTHNIFDTN